MPLPNSCPRCDSPLEGGYLVGQMVYLNWIPAGEPVGWLTVGKEHLATGSFLHPPKLAAVRCQTCGFGVFEQSPSPTGT